ncbi:MAG: amino acid transport protein [Pseudomonadota bacterium]
MPTPSAFFLSMLFGAVGLGFFIYGKKQGRPTQLVVGLILMVFPYFVSNLAWMIGIGVVLTVLPLVLR